MRDQTAEAGRQTAVIHNALRLRSTLIIAKSLISFGKSRWTLASRPLPPVRRHKASLLAERLMGGDAEEVVRAVAGHPTAGLWRLASI
jgi:hypothetical protein